MGVSRQLDFERDAGHRGRELKQMSLWRLMGGKVEGVRGMGMGWVEYKRRADRDDGRTRNSSLATYEFQGELHVLIVHSTINSFKFTED